MLRPTILLTTLLLALAPGSSAAPPAGPASGMASPGWAQGRFDAVLAGTRPGRHLVLVMSAAWCGPCNQLAAEVLDTDAVARALGSDPGLRVDFDGDEGQALTGRYAVINLPTTLVIDPAGREVGRVEGYDGAEAWLEALGEVRAGRQGIEALRGAAVSGRPEDRLALARAELFAGEVERARAQLSALWADPQGAEAATAARTWGRYLLRVRRDARAALGFFDEMSAHFRGSAKDAAHFRYWAASALHAAGEAEAAAARFARWLTEEPVEPRPAAMMAGFLVHFAYPRAACEAAIAELVRRGGPSADTHYLSAVTARAAGDVETARREIAAAVALAPKEALYRNLQRQVGGP
jgi:hypothetical protein